MSRILERFDEIQELSLNKIRKRELLDRIKNSLSDISKASSFKNQSVRKENQVMEELKKEEEIDKDEMGYNVS